MNFARDRAFSCMSQGLREVCAGWLRRLQLQPVAARAQLQLTLPVLRPCQQHCGPTVCCKPHARACAPLSYQLCAFELALAHSLALALAPAQPSAKPTPAPARNKKRLRASDKSDPLQVQLVRVNGGDDGTHAAPQPRVCNPGVRGEVLVGASTRCHAQRACVRARESASERKRVASVEQSGVGRSPPWPFFVRLFDRSVACFACSSTRSACWQQPSDERAPREPSQPPAPLS
jgi:hypothetical protein